MIFFCIRCYYGAETGNLRKNVMAVFVNIVIIIHSNRCHMLHFLTTKKVFSFSDRQLPLGSHNERKR
jgi:hypothetical protein